MGRSGYTSLSIEEKRYVKMRREFEKVIGTENKTFTVWCADTIDSGIERVKFLEKAYPNYTVVKITDDSFFIDDSKKVDVIKVTVQNGKIVCSDKSKDTQRYISYASIHPEFPIGGKK